MSSALTTLMLLVLLSSLALCLFVAALGTMRRERGALPPIALVPLATPVFSWRDGHRGIALALALCLAGYGLVWAAALSSGVGA